MFQYLSTAISLGFPKMVLILIALIMSITVMGYGNNDISNLTTLQTVHIIFRHGQRNPIQIQTYESDLYNNLSYWPEGWGQITENGRLQSFQLGKYIRERYSSFISSTYSREEVDVQCSEYKRTILSVEAALRGLYGQKDYRETATYNFTIIPAADDKTIAVSKKCPRYGQLYFDFHLYSDVMSKFNEDFKHLFHVINKNTGMNITYVSRDLLHFADSIIIKKERGLPLPLWSEELYDSGQLQFILSFRFIALDYTKEMRRLRAGPLLQEILENMRNAVSASDRQRVKTKMFLYSGHETTIADMFISFGVFDKVRNFPYSSAAFLELHQLPQTNKFFVKLFFKHDYEMEAVELEIPNCEYFCQIDRLAGELQDIIPQSWEQECNFKTSTSQGISNTQTTASISGCLIVLQGIQGILIRKVFNF